MTPRITEEFSTFLVDYSLFILSEEIPPREPNDDDDDEDEDEDEEDEDRSDELPIVREPDEDSS
jgi:hypothetical protein